MKKPVDKAPYIRGDVPNRSVSECEDPVCAGLDQALTALDKDREFLTRGGVFTDGMLDAYLALKEQELTRLRTTTHSVEFEMYYSL